MNSKENGGPFKILIREDISVSVENELRNDGYALSAEAPKMMCLQWTLWTCKVRISVGYGS